MDQQQTAIGRAPSGKFQKGHGFKSPGRPRKEKVATVDYLSVLRTCVTEDEHRAIIRRAVIDARNGNRHAREWIYKHLISPTPRLSQLEFSVEANTDAPLARDYWETEADASFRAAVDALNDDELRIMARFNEIRREKYIELQQHEAES